MADEICIHTPTGVICYQNQPRGPYTVSAHLIGTPSWQPVGSGQAPPTTWRAMLNALLDEAAPTGKSPPVQDIDEWFCITRKHVP